VVGQQLVNPTVPGSSPREHNFFWQFSKTTHVAQAGSTEGAAAWRGQPGSGRGWPGSGRRLAAT
jgi:hypothetical protein